MSSSVFASLTAVATAANTVTTGTLSLTDTATTGSGGLVTTIASMAPGDTVTRYVDLVNGGTLNAETSTVKVGIVDSTPTLLTTNGSIGLQITIQACPTAYTIFGGVCASGETTVLATTSALALATANTLISVPSNSAGTTNRLKISISLPPGTEVTTNGALPGVTIQGKTATLAWTFYETQRNSTTTYN